MSKNDRGLRDRNAALLRDRLQSSNSEQRKHPFVHQRRVAVPSSGIDVDTELLAKWTAAAARPTKEPLRFQLGALSVTPGPDAMPSERAVDGGRERAEPVFGGSLGTSPGAVDLQVRPATGLRTRPTFPHAGG